MKRILLLVGVILWCTGTFAQSGDKSKPIESPLGAPDKLSENDKNKSQLAKEPNANLPVSRMRMVKTKDSVYILRGDSLLIRRTTKGPAHKLEEQLPTESPLTPENESPANTSEKGNTKLGKPKKS